MLRNIDSEEKIRSLPRLYVIIIQIAACIVIREFIFYYSHRLLHTRHFYEKHHKRHHHWTAPIAVSAQFADEVEHLCSNLLPIAIPVALLQCHLITQLIFFVHVNLRTLNDHSGYHFPYYYNSERHDKHHEMYVQETRVKIGKLIQLFFCFSFNQYYGIIGLMDWLHGTDRAKLVRKLKSN